MTNETLVENTTGEKRKRMTFNELENTLRALDNAGKEATLRHNDMNETLEDKDKHLPGMNPGKCSLCDEVIYPFEKFMTLETQYLGVSGIPLAEVMTNIRMIRSIMKMVDEEKDGNTN